MQSTNSSSFRSSKFSKDRKNNSFFDNPQKKRSNRSNDSRPSNRFASNNRNNQRNYHVDIEQREQLEAVTTNCEALAENFDSLDLHASVLEKLKALNYIKPTPIQARSIPVILKGKDIVGLAQTGTGKTAAFLLPILTKLHQKVENNLRTNGSVLIVVPTRELADQVYKTVRSLTSFRTNVVYGGVPIFRQKDALRKPWDILIGCPGRLLDLLDRRIISFEAIDTLVLDEADQMFDMGFIHPIRQILKTLSGKQQNILFSATMAGEVAKLVQEVVKNPIIIQVSKVTTPHTISHVTYSVADDKKSDLLAHVLGKEEIEPIGSSLVFTKTKHRAKRVAEFLSSKGFSAVSLQGNLSQSRRAHAIDGFRKGKYKVMVATDIAARGIDISLIDKVIHFDIPDTVEAYVHRSGRTGRAEKRGSVFSFYASREERTLRAIERTLNMRINRGVTPNNLSSATIEAQEFRESRKRDFSTSRNRRSHAGR
jgi:ATP-dependent RNA helicase RhlE